MDPLNHVDPIIIPMEDDLVHDAEHPLCGDLGCDCHDDAQLLAEAADLRWGIPAASVPEDTSDEA